VVVLRVNTAEQKKLCLYTGSSFPIRYINFKINLTFNFLAVALFYYEIVHETHKKEN